MKILMVLDHEFPPDIRVENEIETLTAAGHEIHIACFTMKNQAVYDQFGKAHIHRKSISKLRHKTSVGCLKFPFYYNFWRPFLFGLQQQYQFDIVHIHDLPMARPGFEMKQKYGIRFTLDLHENWPALLEQADHVKGILGKFLSDTVQWKKFELKMCQHADNIIVVVDEARTRLKQLGIEPNKIEVVSNTLNPAHFKIPDTQPDEAYFTLFYAGGINRHRGLQTIIPALKHLPEKVRLFILGDGSFVEELKLISRQNNVVNQVIFLGWQPFDKMNELMGEADICLIPHVKSDHTDNTIPHKLFQYMFAKKPVIASDCKPIERIIRQNKCGKIYEWQDTAALVTIIKSIMNEKQKLKIMGENGYQAVIENHLWKYDAEKLQNIYKA
jgi:glycosyltransferase involved in cell wall biosynthesis